MTPIVTVRLRDEQDVVFARQRAREIASLCGFGGQDQTRIATAVSEIARNAQMYAQGGRAEFAFDTAEPRSFVIRIFDEGPGIHDLNSVLRGRYLSKTGMGIGIQGARRLMDKFAIESSEKGTLVTLRKVLPKTPAGSAPPDSASIVARLSTTRPTAAFEEIQLQNHELMAALDELRVRQEELAQLNRELEDTNRGVVALYADLDEKAEHLRRANQLKSTFLSHMSHEFRTPLNSIMALARILLSRMDGPLTAEQEKQVEFMLRAAQELTDMVNDLLDLAKVEAGKIDLHPSEWTVETLFGTLRGMMKPLVANSPVQLVFEEGDDIPVLRTDEAKVAQILRNFVSNAIKFTERGEVRVSASYDAGTEWVMFAVSDTGIGIAPEDLPRIFEQFVQVESARQRRVRGTGLGLPLSRKFAELLGGNIEAASVPGEGSTFRLSIPLRLPLPDSEAVPAPAIRRPAVGKPKILVVDDEETARYVVGKQLSVLDVSILEASSGAEGISMAAEAAPDLIVLDLMMPDMTGFEVAEQLRSLPQTKDIPIVVHTSRIVSESDRERLACDAVVGKNAASGPGLKEYVKDLLQSR